MTQEAGFLPRPVPFPFAASLVMEFFPPRETQFQFGPSVLPVQPQGDQGQSPSLNGTAQGVDFPLVKEQLARSLRVHGPVGGDGGQRCNLASDQPDGTVFDQGIAVPDLDASRPQGLDFPTLEHQARLVAFLDGVVMACPPVFDLGRGF